MGDMHDAWFFIGIFAFIFVIWFASGGPTRPLSFTGPTLAQPGALGGGTYLQLPRSPFSISDIRGSRDDAGSQTSFTGSSFGNLSPHRGLIKVNRSISGVGASNPVNEQLEIRVAQNAGVPIGVSGWTFSSDVSSKVALIPRGTEVPLSGTINATQEIVLSPGMRAIVISGQSPIGASFRENKCIGYFSTFQKFSPALPQNCPTPVSELASFYEGDVVRDVSCTNYVKTLSRCQVALSPPVTVSQTCQNFSIKYFNYNGCVNAHKNDPDFLGDTWRIYLGRTNSLWRTKNEIVRLLDAGGKTVDAFSY